MEVQKVNLIALNDDYKLNKANFRMQIEYLFTLVEQGYILVLEICYVDHRNQRGSWPVDVIRSQQQYLDWFNSYFGQRVC